MPAIAEETFSGVLGVDRTRGKYSQFHVSGHQIRFAEALFERGRDRCLHLNEKGRELWKKCSQYGGRGVSVKGQAFSEGLQVDRGGPYMERLYVLIEEIKLDPKFDAKPLRSAPKPMPPKILEEDDAEKLEQRLKNMTDRERAVFQARKAHDEQLASWAKDMTIEEFMEREAI